MAGVSTLASENVEPTDIANDVQEDVATEKHGIQQTWGI